MRRIWRGWTASKARRCRTANGFTSAWRSACWTRNRPFPSWRPTASDMLEYDLSRAITRVVTPEKPVVGMMSPLPVFGVPANPMMMRMGQQPGQQPLGLDQLS